MLLDRTGLTTAPEEGQLVSVRDRHWIVKNVAGAAEGKRYGVDFISRPDWKLELRREVATFRNRPRRPREIG